MLTVLGVEKDMARATLRFGLGRFTTREEIVDAADEIIHVVSQLRLMEREFAEQKRNSLRDRRIFKMIKFNGQCGQ